MLIMSYEPPFTITLEMNRMVYRIMEKLVRIEGYERLDRSPRLRKQNRIKSIHSSCSIEANSLSLGQVADIIDGHKVIGPKKDILEVQNAYEAYSLLGSFNPYDMKEFLRIHGILTKDVAEETGKFRSKGEGVFSGDVCIFVAPPPEMVPENMANLFDWLNRTVDIVEPLISSCIFHYEMVFVHPFADGNGRMARLWQTALLGRWRPIFYWIPIENRIEMAQQEYYEVIDKCNHVGNSDAFILFMLRVINSSLEDVEYALKTAEEILPPSVSRLIKIMDNEVWYSSQELMDLLNLHSRSMFLTHYLKPAISRDFIEMKYPDSPRSRYQRYKLKRY